MKKYLLILLLIMLSAPYANAKTLIGVNRLTDELVNIDILTGAGTVIGSTVIPNDPEDYGKGIDGFAYDPLLNVFYALDNNYVDGMHLLKLYPETWNGEAIGNLGRVGVAGLAFDPINRILYGVEVSGIPFNGVPNLISIDINTGSMTAYSARFRPAIPDDPGHPDRKSVV